MLMPPKSLIAVGGENLIDSIQDQSGSAHDGYFHNLGGSPYNVAVALARQGITTHYITPISSDAFGDRLAAHLQDQGVVTSGPRLAAPTTQAIVTLEKGVPKYQFLRDGTAERMVTTEILQSAFPSAATHFHIGSLALADGSDAAVWEKAFIEAARLGICTSLDPNVRASLITDPVSYRKRITRLLTNSSIVKLSDEDLDWLYPSLDHLNAITKLREQTSAKLLVLTKGPEGAEAWTPQHYLSLANPQFSGLVDTIGAGDTFMGTLLAGLADNGQLTSNALDQITSDNLASLIKRAIYAACLNCTKEGCDPPFAEQLEHALSEERL